MPEAEASWTPKVIVIVVIVVVVVLLLSHERHKNPCLSLIPAFALMFSAVCVMVVTVL